MPSGITFHAIATSASVPEEIRIFFDERLEVRSIFGTKCYILLESDDKSPLNLMDEDLHRKTERWLATVNSSKIFSYVWKP